MSGGLHATRVVGKLAELNRAVGTGVPPKGIEQASLYVKNNILAASPSRLRNVGKRGAKLGVRYLLYTSGDSADSFIRGTGPWPLIERDTKPHPIPKLKGSRSRKGGNTRQYGPAFGGSNEAKFLALPDGEFRGQVFHPGTKGKHPFEKASVASMPGVAKILETNTYEACRQVFSF